MPKVVQGTLEGVKSVKTISVHPGDCLVVTKDNISRGKLRDTLLGLAYATKKGLGAIYLALVASMVHWRFSTTEGEALAGDVLPEHVDWFAELLRQREEIATGDYFGNGTNEASIPDSDDKLTRENCLAQFDRIHETVKDDDGNVIGFRKPLYRIAAGHRRAGRAVIDASAILVARGETPIDVVIFEVLQFFATSEGSSEDTRMNYIIYSNERRKRGFQATTTAEKFQAAFNMFDRAQSAATVEKVFNNGEKQRMQAFIWYTYRFAKVVDSNWAENYRNCLCDPDTSDERPWQERGFAPSAGNGDTKAVREKHQPWTHHTTAAGKTGKAKDVLEVLRFVETPEGAAKVRELMEFIDSIRAGETKNRAPKQVGQDGLSDIASRFDADSPIRKAMEHLKANNKSEALSELMSIKVGMSEGDKLLMESLKTEVINLRAEKVKLENERDSYKARTEKLETLIDEAKGRGVNALKEMVKALPPVIEPVVEVETETKSA